MHQHNPVGAVGCFVGDVGIPIGVLGIGVVDELGLGETFCPSAEGAGVRKTLSFRTELEIVLGVRGQVGGYGLAGVFSDFLEGQVSQLSRRASHRSCGERVRNGWSPRVDKHPRHR